MATVIHLACLCAAWCRLCDDYTQAIAQVKAAFDARGAELRWHWVDIEDEAELVGEFDVETFPTWVVCDASSVRFAGPLQPQPETLQRLLRATVTEAQPGAAWPAVAPEVQAFAARLRERATPVGRG